MLFLHDKLLGYYRHFSYCFENTLFSYPKEVTVLIFIMTYVIKLEDYLKDFSIFWVDPNLKAAFIAPDKASIGIRPKDTSDILH